ncbi:MAG: hypothetical protein QM774_10385 [Gordonia sp. (in: high G+C Gram-positive bacteria)]|uniref:hypothetical protein n=1 Tax=Gordonia sp. (in: high G+C Gram-positive bacteria) TaxID=84139 RepID=UPI0039E6B744
MTVSAPGEDLGPADPDVIDDEVEAPRHPPRVANTSWRIALRWTVLVALTVFAYWGTLRAVAFEMSERTLLVYLPVALVLCLIAALGVTLRHDQEPPIYDRDTDFIVGIVVLVLALLLEGLLNRRYMPAYLVTHVDVLSMVVFVFGGCVLLFGLRPTMRYRWVWVLSLSMFPLPFRIAVLSLGGSRIAAGAVMLLLCVAATVVAVGYSRRAALWGAVASAILGSVLLVFIAIIDPHGRVGDYMWWPSVGCAFIIAAFVYVQRRIPHRTLRMFPGRELRPLTAPQVPRAMILLAVAAAILHFVSVPKVTVDDGPTIAGLRTAPPLIVPADWHQIRSTPPGPVTVYGWDATRDRQVLEQNQGDPRFDVHARPRRVAVDVIDTALPMTLDVYLPTFTYQIDDTRLSPPVDVALPHGVSGVLQTIVDDKRLLTYNRMMWRWNDGTRTQQVTLFSVDNHEASAGFPQFRRKRDTWHAISGMLTLVLRGNAVTEDLNPRFKDRDLLTELAGDLIETQIASTGGGHG